MPTHHFSVQGVKLSITKKYGIYYASLTTKPNRLIVDVSFEGAVRKALFSAMALGLVSREAHNRWVTAAFNKEVYVMESSIEKFQVGTAILEIVSQNGMISAKIKSPDHHETIRIVEAGKTLGEARVYAVTMAQQCGLVTQEQVDEALGRL